MDYINIDCITGASFFGFNVIEHRQLPKKAKFLSFGEANNGDEFSVYITDKKTYIFFKKNRRNIW